MDSRHQLLQRIDSLQDLHAWDFDKDRQRHSCTIDDYTIHIDRDGTHGYLWQLEHERYGVLMPWVPAPTTAVAKTDALAYTRAHLNANLQHQHAE